MILLSLLLAPVQSMAADTELARQYVETVGGQVFGLINSKSPTANDELKTILEQNIDVEGMAPYMIGDAWNTATPEQQSEYLTSFRVYLLKRYSNNFADYTGSQYTVQDAVAEDETEYLVHMQIKTKGGKDKQADYRLKENEGVFKITDIVFEGISLINTQRSEFAAVLQKKGMPGLLADLRAKNVN